MLLPKLFGIKLPLRLGQEGWKGKVRVSQARHRRSPRLESPRLRRPRVQENQRILRSPRPEKSKKHKKVSLREIKKFTAPQVRSKWYGNS